MVIASRVEEVSSIRHAVGEQALIDGFSASEAANIEVAVGEGAANAVRHGSPNGEADYIAVVYRRVSGTHIQIEIEDHGRGFDLERCLNEPDGGVDEVDFCEMSEGGRGLMIMAALMDDVRYERGQHGGRLYMRKRLPREPRGPVIPMLSERPGLTESELKRRFTSIRPA